MKQKTKKDIFSNSIFAEGGFYVKLSFTIFLVALYLIIFFLNDGLMYFEAYKYSYKYQNYPFQVHVIDVENGDAILVKLPDNKTMLIDTGEERYYKRVESYLRQYNYYEKLNKIDYLVLTHSDSDHIGSASKIIKNFNVGKIFRPKVYSQYEIENLATHFDYQVSDSEIYNNAIKSAYENNCELIFSEKGITFDAGECKIEFLSPKLNTYSDMNNYSAVIMMTYKSRKFLFMGDAEESIEKSLVQDYGEYLKADVLKIGHHGSKTSTSAIFLDYVKPTYAIVSSSGSSSILPNYEVIKRLQDNNIKILATANLENFVVSLQNEEIVSATATKGDNNLALLLTIFIILIFIIWKNPFKGLKNASISNKK